MRETDLLIIGLGPVGSTAANIAGALGLDSVGVDLSPTVYGLPRAIHFDAEIMRIFQSVGLADEVLEIVRVGRGSVHLGADGDPIRDFRSTGQTGDLGWSPHYMFYQPQLDQLLRDRAGTRESVALLLGLRCEGVEQDGEGVIATFVDEAGETSRIRAKYLLACDGASSAVRRELGIDLFDYGFEEPWVVVDVRVPDETLGPDHFVTRCDPARPIVYAPGPGRHRRWEFMILPGENPQQLIEVEKIREVVGSAASWLDVDQAELIRSAIYTFHGLVARRWSEGRIFLGGDAAHQTPPFYAQGMCHGIRDVNGLIWKLAMVLRGEADPRLLDTYQREREPHVRAIIEASVDNGRYICMLDPQEAGRRDEAFRQRMRNKQDVGSFRGMIPGLDGGLLADQRPRPDGVGELIVQPQVRDESGLLVRLDDLLGPGFAAVTIGDPDFLAGDWFVNELCARVIGLGGKGREPFARRAVDETGMVSEWLRGHGAECALVRPDRYVFGLAATPDELLQLTARLREMLGGESVSAMALAESSS